MILTKEGRSILVAPLYLFIPQQFRNNPRLIFNKGRLFVNKAGLLENKAPLLKNKAGLFCIVLI